MFKKIALPIAALIITTSLVSFASSDRFSGSYTIIKRSGHAVYGGDMNNPASLEYNCPDEVKIDTSDAYPGALVTGCGNDRQTACPMISVQGADFRLLMAVHDGNSKIVRSMSESATSSDLSVLNVEESATDLWSRKISRLSSDQIEISFVDILKDIEGGAPIKDLQIQCVYKKIKD